MATGTAAGDDRGKARLLARRFADFILALSAVLLLIAVALNFANIVGRYVFLAPIASAEEVMLFLLVGIVFLGNSVVGFEGKQLRMDVLLHALPPRLRHGLEVFADLTMIVVCVTLIVVGWPAIQMLAEFDQRSEAADIPLVIPQSLVPIGLGLNALLVSLRLMLRRGRTQDTATHHEVPFS
jgi:TRAP-type C4-dicarboxylate transport system permease small subunit